MISPSLKLLKFVRKFGGDIRVLGSVVDGGWRRVKNPPYWPTCGTSMYEYGIVVPPSFTKLAMAESQ